MSLQRWPLLFNLIKHNRVNALGDFKNELDKEIVVSLRLVGSFLTKLSWIKNSWNPFSVSIVNVSYSRLIVLISCWLVISVGLGITLIFLV